MAATPQFGAVPVIALAQVSTANTNRDGTGTLVSVVTGATNGTRIDRITVIATGTTTAGMIRLFIYDGTNNRLWKEIPTSAVTPSGTVPADIHILAGLALVLPNNYILKASTNNAETWNIIPEGENF